MKKYTLVFCLVFSILSITFFQKNVFARPATPTPSAIIVEKYVKHSDSTNIVCKDETKCSGDSTNNSQSATLTINDSRYHKGSFNSQFTKAFGDRYGLTGRSDSGQQDLKTFTGNMTLTALGPNGYTETLTMPPSGWSVGGPARPSDNIKGSDTSANWTVFFGGVPQGVFETYSYSGDSQQSLVVTGDPSRLYRVLIVGSATEWHLGKVADYGPEFNPHYVINGSEVFCPNIKVMGSKLSYDCGRSFTLGPGTYDVTPSTNIPRFMYTINVRSIEDAGPAQSPSSTQTSSVWDAIWGWFGR